jgi:M6 family metalloprotease-like protein
MKALHLSIRKTLFFIGLLSCLGIGLVQGVPYHGFKKMFKQPDGSVVEVRLFGSEFYMRAESADGYTLVRHPKTGWICYARVSPEGSQLVSTGVHFTGSTFPRDLLPELKPHTDLSPENRIRIEKRKSLQLAGNRPEMLSEPGHPHVHGTPVVPVSGNLVGLTILVDFPDEASTLPRSEFELFCNQLDYQNFGNKGSLRTYFKDVSKGKIDYTNQVVGFFRAPKTFAYYDSLPLAQGAQIVLKMALDSLDAQGFDFSQLTLNEDNTIQAINLMYTGEPPVWAEGMWHHKGTFTDFVSSSGIGSKDYNCSPANAPLGIGVVAHENGHMIGKWPDTYKYTSTNGPDGIGSFDLMCWYGDGQNPVPPNPLFTANAGWGKTIDVTYLNGVVQDTANSGTRYQFRNPTDTNEFFLFESRTKTGRSFYIPDAGLTVWHIDRKGNNQSRHHEVRLVAASNDSANQSQACFRKFYKTEFSYGTVPNSKWYNGDPSGLRIWDVGARGAVVPYKIGLGVAGPSLQLKFMGISSEQFPNGFAEPGENLHLDWEIVNGGQLASDSLQAFVSALPPSTSLVQFSGSQFPIQSISAGNSRFVSIPAQISSLAESGSELVCRLRLGNSNPPVFATASVPIGLRITMQEGEDSLCDGLFLDPGGLFDYEDNQEVLMTLFPQTPGAKIRVSFLDFALEAHPNCGYDYLKVHNGPSTTSPVLGLWCGNDGPDTVQSTHSTGALTFVFRSDEGVRAAGWKAKVSCLSAVSVEAKTSETALRIFPNPASKSFFLTGVRAEGDLFIRDAMGRTVKAIDLKNWDKGPISLDMFSPGLYEVQWKTAEGNQKSSRLIVQP